MGWGRVQHQSNEGTEGLANILLQRLGEKHRHSNWVGRALHTEKPPKTDTATFFKEMPLICRWAEEKVNGSRE